MAAWSRPARRSAPLSSLLLLSIGALASTSLGAEFVGLGVGSGTDEATAVSGDGNVVAGRNITGTLGWRWSAADGVEYLGFQPSDVSFDGSTIVGTFGFFEAARWTHATGMIKMNDLAPNDGTPYSLAFGVSADGSVIVGATAGAPFLWNQADGMVASPAPYPLMTNGSNVGVSADGTVTAGVLTKVGAPNAGTHYYRSVDGTATEIFGLTLAGGDSGISADGTVVFGLYDGGNTDAAFWSNGVVTSIGTLPGFDGSFVEGTSAAGDCFAGNSFKKTGEFEAMFWDDVNGLRSVRSMLEDDFGLADQLTGWKLKRATDVSDDCSTIVGVGVDPGGHSEAWIVTGFSKVPMPCARPVSAGSGGVVPKATDCLYILKVAVGLQACPVECVCAPSGNLPAHASDALLCLKSAVGQSVVLDCPCN